MRKHRLHILIVLAVLATCRLLHDPSFTPLPAAVEKVAVIDEVFKPDRYPTTLPTTQPFAIGKEWEALLSPGPKSIDEAPPETPTTQPVQLVGWTIRTINGTIRVPGESVFSPQSATDPATNLILSDSQDNGRNGNSGGFYSSGSGGGGLHQTTFPQQPISPTPSPSPTTPSIDQTPSNQPNYAADSPYAPLSSEPNLGGGELPPVGLPPQVGSPGVGSTSTPPATVPEPMGLLSVAFLLVLRRASKH